jgi:hypothetical protein
VSGQEQFQRDVEQRLSGWLAAVRRVPPEGFTEVARLEDICRQVCADSWFWCDAMFTEQANPHSQALGRRHAFHVATEDTPDLLRHEYTVAGLDLAVTESRNFVLVEVARSSLDLLGLAGPDRAAAVRRIAESLFAQAGRAQFVVFSGPAEACSLDDIVEGTALCTNPSADPVLLSCWADRMECGIQEGRLYFLCYKKSSQRAGYENAQQWFDDAFRARTG